MTADPRVKLLLVDDRPENLLALEAILEPLGQTLVSAHSGDEALKCVLQHDFAAILLDVQMPDMNGFDVAQIIKSREKSRYIPIIFLSAINKEDAYVFKGYSMGAVDYVFKPFNPDVLRSKVAVFVDLYLKQEQLREQSEQLAESARRELELEHKTELLEAEAKSAAKLSELNRQLQDRQNELEQAMGVRNRFYASMSHELRTPINAVIGYSTLMIDNIYGPLNEKQREGLQRTLRAARHLLELVNDVLDLSKIEAGKIELALQPVNIPGLIDDLFVTVRPLADEHGSSLTFSHPEEQIKIVTDPRRVRQILLNLLSNAIKFGRQKPISVSCERDENGGILVKVVDQGEGISEENRGRIFEEFVQVSETQQVGTGLGLPISRRLASLLDGTLEVESVVGEGSTFTLKLPPETQAKSFDFADQTAEKQAHDAAARASENPSEKGPGNDVPNDAPEGAQVA
ncbi:MAG TPA: hybrid sensor histidine kinase/response regulator [Gemmatimonadaceae bacterium]|nr:hybrid sensor histidine kinase/response regulator [Gemmatimonadaceae bacterium]